MQGKNFEQISAPDARPEEVERSQANQPPAQQPGLEVSGGGSQATEQLGTQEAALANLSERMARFREAKQELDEAALQARRLGVSWVRLGSAAGISESAAHQRWSPQGRRRHAEYQRKRYQQGTTPRKNWEEEWGLDPGEVSPTADS